MSFVLPQVALQRVLQIGLKALKQDQDAFYQLFNFYTEDEMAVDYGVAYIDSIWKWFSETKIPVQQAWSFNAAKLPQLTIHLGQEQEDEGKAAMGDFFGQDSLGEDIGMGAFSVMLDIGIHAGREGDEVLWLYYIVGYILFKNKLLAEKLGLRLQTFSATDYNKESKYMADNVWSRWVRFRCIVQDYWTQVKPTLIDDMEIGISIHSANTDADP